MGKGHACVARLCPVGVHHRALLALPLIRFLPSDTGRTRLPLAFLPIHVFLPLLQMIFESLRLVFETVVVPTFPPVALLLLQLWFTLTRSGTPYQKSAGKLHMTRLGYLTVLQRCPDR